MTVLDDYLKNYISEHMENSYEMDYTRLTEQMGAEKYFYDELPCTEVKGYPVASDFVGEDGTAYSMNDYEKLSESKKSKCRLRYYYLPNVHEIYLGTTGSGKTTGCIEPQLRAISSQKNKPNIFITDPKGELFNRNAEHLKKMGYRTYVLNFKNTARSNKWNPLEDLLDVLREIKKTRSSSPLPCTGRIPDGVIKGAPSSSFTSGRYYLFAGMAYPTSAMAKQAKELRESDLSVELSSLITQLGNMFIKVESTKDPFWDKSAQDQVKGFLQAMCDYLLDPFSGFTEDMFTIYTMTQFFVVLKRYVTANGCSGSLRNAFEHPLLTSLPKTTQNMFSTVFACATNTMLSHLSVLGGGLAPWSKPHIYALTTGNDIELFDEEDTPFAIFVITRDYESSDYDIAALFVDWVYRHMVEHAEECTQKNKPWRTTHFLLDEFGNIPHINSFETKIATSRSRSIYFHLVLQSYAQLKNVYNLDSAPGAAEIIKDNCNSINFLGSQNVSTKKSFSEDCGSTAILSPFARPDAISGVLPVNTVPLMPLSKLDLIIPGDIYCKRIFTPLIKARYVRSYVAAAHGDYPGFSPARGLSEFTPVSIESFMSEKFRFPKFES